MLSEIISGILITVGGVAVLAFCGGAWKVWLLIRGIHHQVFPNSGGSMFDKVVDISDALKTQDAKFKAYQDADEVMTFEADPEGRVTWTNSGIEKLFGRNPDQMLGYDWILSVEPDEQESVRREYRARVSERSSFDCNVRLRTGIWVHIVVNPIGQGKSFCYSGHCRTISRIESTSPKPI